MGRFIIKIKDKYLEWSTVTDAPTTFGMNLDEFKEYYQDEYGRSAMARLDSRLKRVDRNGTSSLQDYSLAQLITVNRAGENESQLTLSEIYKTYCQEPYPSWA